MNPIDAEQSDYFAGGPSFTLRNRLFRLLWILSWALLAKWTPPPFHRWRRWLLCLFGAKLGKGVRIYGSSMIWYPPNLTMGDQSALGPRVLCYNQGRITIGSRTTVSQGAHLCAGTHDFRRRDFQLITKPITIGDDAWVAADAFVGPGATVRDGCVVGARAVLFGEGAAWTIYSGNPAQAKGERRFIR